MCPKCDYNITNLLNDFFRAWRINNIFTINGAEKVIALEPFPEPYELGKYNIKINNLENKVFLLPYALANYEGYTEFIISSDNPNANTVNPSPYIIGSGLKFEQKIKVPTISLISMINIELGIKPILEDNPRFISMSLMRRIRGKYKDFQIILRQELPNPLTM